MSKFVVIKMFVLKIVVLKTGLPNFKNKCDIVIRIFYTSAFIQIIYVDRLISMIKIFQSTKLPYFTIEYIYISEYFDFCI